MLGKYFALTFWEMAVQRYFHPHRPNPFPPPEKKESNSKFDKPAGRDANLLGLRSSPEEIDVKLKYIIVEEMTFDQELCLKSVWKVKVMKVFNETDLQG